MLHDQLWALPAHPPRQCDVVVIVGSDYTDIAGPTELAFNARIATNLGAPVLLVNPGVALSTAKVFAAWDGVDRGPLGDWRGGRNDLEPAARRLVPAIGDVLDWLREREGVNFSRMSGSGATCFALFDSEEERDAAATACPSHWWHLASFLR